MVQEVFADTGLREADRIALSGLADAEPTLVDVRPAVEVVPGMTPSTVLTSGPPLPWPHYSGGQRMAIIGAVLHEKLAGTVEEAVALLDSGAVRVEGCQDHDVVGSLAGVTSASMPVFVVADRASGRRAYCTLFEGAAKARLNYGVYNDEVEANLVHLRDVIGPTLREALAALDGGIPLLPIMERAVHLGDEMHSRNTAASLLFVRDLLIGLVRRDAPRTATRLLDYLTVGDYLFLRLSMAACKVMADRMADVPGSGVVTAMAFSCKEFGIRVSGTGSQWWRGQLPAVETFLLFDGHTEDEIEVMGGESPITETCGLGGLSQAAAFGLARYQGGTPERLVERTLEMYRICAAEHPHFRIPFLAYRGSPLGIDVRRVAATGITPVMDVGIAGRGGGQIGAGCFRAPLQPFLDAAAALDNP